MWCFEEKTPGMSLRHMSGMSVSEPIPSSQRPKECKVKQLWRSVGPVYIVSYAKKTRFSNAK